MFALAVLDPHREADVGKACVPLVSGRLDDCKSFQQENNFELVSCKFSVPSCSFYLGLASKKTSLLSSVFAFTFAQFYCLPPCSRISEDGDKKLLISPISVSVSTAYSFTMFPFTEVLLRHLDACAAGDT